jgi:hypothetical protein
MKSKIFFFSILSLFALSSCNKDRITLKIVAPKDGDTFMIYEDIDVNVTATTQKGTIMQVILDVDLDTTFYLTKEPFDFLIPKYTFKDSGIYFLSVTAYSSEGVQEGAAIDIIIKNIPPRQRN